MPNTANFNEISILFILFFIDDSELESFNDIPMLIEVPYNL